MADIPRADFAPHGDDVIDEDGDALPAAAAACPGAAAAAAPAAPPGVIDEDAAEAAGEDAEGLPPHAVTQPDGSVILPLLRPVTLRFKRGGAVREETVERLRLHRLTGADLRAISAASRDRMSAVGIARSARVPEMRMNAIYDRMDAADAAAADRVVASFLGSGPRTGR